MEGGEIHEKASRRVRNVGWIVPRNLITRDGGGYVFRPTNEAAGSLVRLETPEALSSLAAHSGVRTLAGLDIYWYTWIAVNRGTILLQ